MRLRHTISELPGRDFAYVSRGTILTWKQFTWARKPDWSHFYSSSEEIWQYFRDIVDTYSLEKYMKLQHEVRSAVWDGKEGQWQVEIKNLVTGSVFTDRAEVLINGGGILK